MNILVQPDDRGDTLLSLAVAARNLVAVQKLLDESVDTLTAWEMCRVRDSDDTQPLQKAALRGCAEICQLLVDCGAPTDENGEINEYGSTPLDAAFKGWQEYSGDNSSKLQDFERTVSILIPGSDGIAGDFRKFICATWRRSQSICKHFESAKANEDKHGWLPAVISAAFGDLEVARSMCSNSNREYVEQLLSGEVLSKPHGHKPSKWSVTDKHNAVTLSKKRMVASFTNCGKMT